MVGEKPYTLTIKSMSNILTVVDEVQVSQEMVDLYAKRFRIDPVANQPGILGSIIGWIGGKGELDAHLTDTEEGRAVGFDKVRTAYFKALGQEEPTEMSKVQFEQIAEVAPEASSETAV